MPPVYRTVLDARGEVREPKAGQRVRHLRLGFGVVGPAELGWGDKVIVAFDGAALTTPCHPGDLEFDADDRELLPMWAVYDHPRDYPTQFVARRWVSLPQIRITHAVRMAPSLDELRDAIGAEHMHRLERDVVDDPKILEVWLV